MLILRFQFPSQFFRVSLVIVLLLFVGHPFFTVPLLLMFVLFPLVLYRFRVVLLCLDLIMGDCFVI